MSKIRPLFNPCFTVSTPDGRNGIRIRQLEIPDFRKQIMDGWQAKAEPSKTYNANHGRERGRRSHDVDAPCKPELVERVREQVQLLATEYNYQGRTATLASSQILLYTEGPGCPVHCDDQDAADDDYGMGSVMFNWANQLVALLFLTQEDTDFTGGQLFFPNADFYVNAVPGKLIAFPGHYKYKHGVTPILSGTRVLLQTTWRFDL